MTSVVRYLLPREDMKSTITANSQTQKNIRYEVIRLGNSGAWWKRASGPAANAVIFVHGWGGDFLTTWTKTTKLKDKLKFWKSTAANVCLMDLLAVDETMSGYDIYSFGHAGGPLSKSSISIQADALRTFAQNCLTNHEHVVLVAHSLGGLVCRKMIVDWLDHEGAKANKVLGLLTLGTPNNGTELARIPSLSKSATQMAPLNEFLAELNRDWLRRIINGGDPAEEHHGRTILKCRVAIGETDRVVPPASAGTACLFGEMRVISRTGHLELCKPNDTYSPVYDVIRTFLQECETEQRELPRVHAAASFAAEARREILTTSAWCLRERESITINRFNPPNDSPLAGRNDLLTCDITCQRVGVVAKSTINVLINLEKHCPDEIPVDYYITIGKGFFQENDFDAFAELMKFSVEQKTSPLAMINYVKIMRGSGTVDYQLSTADVRCRPGWIVLPFTCSSDLCDGRRHPEDILEFQLREIVSEKQGWHRYCNQQVIVESLSVEVDSSIPIRLKDSFRGKSVKRTGGQTGSRFSAKLQLTGPTPPQCWVEWNF